MDEQGGVGQVAKVFGLSEVEVWGWVDSHCIPDLYLRYLIDPGQRISEVQLSTSGYEDPVSGDCLAQELGAWKRSFRLNA